MSTIQIIQGEVAAGVPAEKIVLGGFSQGGAVTLHVCLRSTTRLAGTWGSVTLGLVTEETVYCTGN